MLTQRSVVKKAGHALHVGLGFCVVAAYGVVKILGFGRGKTLRAFLLQCGQLNWIPRDLQAYLVAVSIRRCVAHEDWTLARAATHTAGSVFEWNEAGGGIARIVFEVALLNYDRDAAVGALNRLENLGVDESWMTPVFAQTFGKLSLSDLAIKLDGVPITINIHPLRLIILAAVAEEQRAYISAAIYLEELAQLKVFNSKTRAKIATHAGLMRSMSSGDIVAIDNASRGPLLPHSL